MAGPELLKNTVLNPTHWANMFLFDVRLSEWGAPQNFIAIDYFPTEFSDEWGPDYDEVAVMGSRPRLGYSSSSLRRISFTVTFVATMPTAKFEVENKVNWLRTFLNPTYVSDNMYPPKMMRLTIGKHINEVVTLMSAGVTWRSPWEVYSHYPYAADVDCEFVVHDDFPHKLTPFSLGALKVLSRWERLV